MGKTLQKYEQAENALQWKLPYFHPADVRESVPVIVVGPDANINDRFAQDLRRVGCFTKIWVTTDPSALHERFTPSVQRIAILILPGFRASDLLNLFNNIEKYMPWQGGYDSFSMLYASVTSVHPWMIRLRRENETYRTEGSRWYKPSSQI
jgi:hypothetical protein